MFLHITPEGIKLFTVQTIELSQLSRSINHIFSNQSSILSIRSKFPFRPSAIAALVASLGILPISFI